MAVHAFKNNRPKDLGNQVQQGESAQSIPAVLVDAPPDPSGAPKLENGPGSARLHREDNHNAHFRARICWWVSASALLSTLICLLIFAAGTSNVLLPLIPALISLGIGFMAVAGYHKFHIEQLADSKAKLALRLEQLEDQTWELRESEERYRSLSEAFGDLVVHRTPQGRVIFANDAFVEVFGCTRNDRFDRSDLQVGDPSDQASGDGLVQELCLKTNFGDRWYHWLDIPIRDDLAGQATIRSVARDVTEHKKTEIALRKASEKAQLASNAKSRFLGNVSHEMRTPLNGILGMSDLLSSTRLTPDQRTYNDAVRTSGAALLALVEDILDIAKIEANRFDLKKEKFCLDGLIENITELISVKAHAKGVGLSSYVSHSVPEMIVGDEGRLRQVLINLLGNAVKFTESGEVAIRVTTMGLSDSQHIRLHFEVEDTGPGMSEADAGRIFGEFVQVDDENTRKHGGAGLGLSISQAIVQQMDGTIQIDSEPGKGSRFHFDLAFPCDGKGASDGSGTGHQQLSGKQVLLLSKSRLELETLALAIEDAGGTAIKYRNLKDAYAALKEMTRRGDPIDHVLLDGSVSRDPDVSLAKLRHHYRGKLHSTILLKPDERGKLSAHFDAGFDAFLIKPVRTKSLLNVLSGGTPKHSSAPALAPSLDPGTSDSRGNRSLHILLAEDNDINALLATSVLQKAGHRVTRAENGKRAVTEFRKHARNETRFDLILMDLHMPVMDGLDAVAKIRAYEKSKKIAAAKIIVLTADEQARTRQEAQLAGSDGYLTKPFVPARLIELTRDLADAAGA